MEHKSWIWKKKFAVGGDCGRRSSFTRTADDLEIILKGKAELERDIQKLNDKLSSALLECNAKDDFSQRQAKIAQEAIAGWEKAETEALYMKQELENALYQIAAGDKRLVSLDSALSECMHQLRSVQREQEKRIRNAVFETSKEFEKRILALEENLSKLGAENTQLSKALLGKEKVIENLSSQRDKAERELSALMTRLDSLEKENVSLKSEEWESDRRSSEASHKQHLENVKRIARLESECQRLRLLVRKRLPGPASMAKMKNTGETRPNPSMFGSMDFASDVGSNKRIQLLIEQLCMLEEENRNLKEALHRNARTVIDACAVASETSQAEGQFSQIPTDCLSVQPAGKCLQCAQELCVVSQSDMGSGNKASCVKMQSFTPFSKSMGAFDMMNLMDDFVEMEKLAVEKTDEDCVSEILASTQKSMNPSIGRVIEIIEGILPYRVSETQAGYTVRHFQWKTSELSLILQEFVQTCQDLMDGNANLEKFGQHIVCTLEWIVNHCFSLQDVSSMEDAIKNHFQWNDDSWEECEVGPSPHLTIESCNRKSVSQVEETQSKTVETESLMVQLQESENTINSLKMEVENLRGLNLVMTEDEDEDEKHEIIREGLEVQIESTKQELNEVCQKYSHLESITNEEIPQHALENEEQLRQNDLEIEAASEKLAECQETILNLGKQLKALALPRDMPIFDNVISTPVKNLARRSSLLDIMLDEDNGGQCCQSPKTKELTLNGNGHSALGTSNAIELPPEDVPSPIGNRNTVEEEELPPEDVPSPIGNRNTVEEEDHVDSLTIVSSKKRNGGLLSKLFWKLQKDHLISCIKD
ncbi:unnamed protein product [Cuscuta epithymum]|uniref:Filament-like plant protein 7 n=1 Tax=Cuscuta epithymum TaxID=186058 RepID=A0AAV0GC92_9ASTE|nr:unnamed protein product [Cuscuta epithymum]